MGHCGRESLKLEDNRGQPTSMKFRDHGNLSRTEATCVPTITTSLTARAELIGPLDVSHEDLPGPLRLLIYWELG